MPRKTLAPVSVLEEVLTASMRPRLNAAEDGTERIEDFCGYVLQ